MNFCDDYHIFDNFDDLDSSTRFPMLESALPQLGNKLVIMRIVSSAKKMTNICVQKYVLARVSDNNSKSDSEYRDYMFMQGWYYFLTSLLENFWLIIYGASNAPHEEISPWKIANGKVSMWVKLKAKVRSQKAMVSSSYVSKVLIKGYLRPVPSTSIIDTVSIF